MIAKVSSVFALAAVLVSAEDAKAPVGLRNAAPANNHEKVYLTVTVPNIVQPAPIVQNAAT
ncbi:hypothetical protein EV174_005963, partial [Coemansia sp. RSA 2320]